ncbi:hypothetical protein NDI53_08145 [Leptolyngbya sp. NM3-A1]
MFALVGTLTPESFRTNRLPLLNLPKEVLDALRTGQLEYTKARAIAKIKEAEQRQQLLEKAITENLSLAQIKEEVQQKSPTKAGNLDFNRRFSKIGKVIQQRGLLDDVKKREQIEKLLKSLENLIGE